MGNSSCKASSEASTSVLKAWPQIDRLVWVFVCNLMICSLFWGSQMFWSPPLSFQRFLPRKTSRSEWPRLRDLCGRMGWKTGAMDGDGDGTWCTNSEDCYGIMGMARPWGSWGSWGLAKQETDSFGDGLLWTWKGTRQFIPLAKCLIILVHKSHTFI